MISEQDKQAILNGAYGVTRKGNKVKYLFKSDINQPQNRYLFAEYVENNGKVDFHNSLWLSEDFTFYVNTRKEHNLDVIGLWKDKPEPFSLQKALDGKFFTHKDIPNIKCKLVGKSIFNTTDEYYVVEREDSIVTIWSLFTLNYYCEMYKEPEPESNTVTLTLPCALKEPKDDMWFISIPELEVRKSAFTAKDAKIQNNTMFSLGLYFDSEEKAKVMLHFLKNSKE